VPGARTLNIGPRDGGYEGMPRKLRFRLVVVGPRTGHGLDDGAGAGHVVEYSGKPVRIRAGAAGS
jgi:hypothetical protein